MNNTEHTPGPWSIDLTNDPGKGVTFWRLIDADGQKHQILTCDDPFCEGEIVGEGNARLISAAPDLLQSAKLALQFMESRVPPNYKVMQALSKAIEMAERRNK